ncbi:Uncharacterized protein XB16_1867 [Leptospira santarosai]|uniref:Uncharacterized protein n=1 Tax=Leptospira santarosai TaxID=28183 RepID=A0A2P1QTG0_9LEPT|nr:Uncharacterized protein XB16_1867 [Leptospira santarosai]
MVPYSVVMSKIKFNTTQYEHLYLKHRVQNFKNKISHKRKAGQIAAKRFLHIRIHAKF